MGQERAPDAAALATGHDVGVPNEVDVADRLERIVADDLWPLPKYSEMLFIK